jgi:hypothetical protein
MRSVLKRYEYQKTFLVILNENCRVQRGRPAVAVCWGRATALVRQCDVSRVSESNTKR